MPILAVLLVLGVVLYFIHPLAPLFLLVSLLIQAPIVLLLTRASLGSSYRERAAARRQQYEKDENAGVWLDGEEKEAKSIGYKYWSRVGKSLCALNRAEILLLLGRTGEAGNTLAMVEEKKLAQEDRRRYETIKEQTAQ